MGKTGPKRNRMQREALRVEITRRLLESQLQADIARELGIDFRLVSYYARTAERAEVWGN